jgi:ABC-2 type transport system permease protein
VNGFLALLSKEWMEIRRTWRIWVMPGLLLFFGLTSPILAEIAPRLVKSIASDQPGTVIELPPAVALDAYRQLTKSLTQIVLIALVIATADIVSGERRSGTAVLVLTKPISRSAFVVAKTLAQAALIGVATVAAAAVCWIGTRAIFGEAPGADLATAIGLWLVLAGMVIAAMTLLSVLLPAQAGAAGVGIALYALLLLLAQWEPARSYSPAGLFDAIDAAAAGTAAHAAWPALTAILATAICIWAAIWRFDRQEISGSITP